MRRARATLAFLVIALALATVVWLTGSGQQPAEVATVVTPEAPALLAGSWTSEDDAQYGVVFEAGGSVVESYAGEVISRGTYRFAESPAGYSDVEHPTGHPHEFLLEDIDGERYAYRVSALTADRLEIKYLERGNTLSFTKQQ
jgi:hypothetical protein